MFKVTHRFNPITINPSDISIELQRNNFIINMESQQGIVVKIIRDKEEIMEAVTLPFHSHL